MDAFVEKTSGLAAKKEHFDKQLLVDFYHAGLELIERNKTMPDQCPFCDTPFGWQELKQQVSSRLGVLDFAAISSLHLDLVSDWQKLHGALVNKAQALAEVELPSVKEALQAVPAEGRIRTAIALQSFDPALVIEWSNKSKELASTIQLLLNEIEQQKHSLGGALGHNPSGELRAQVDTLSNILTTLRELKSREHDIKTIARRVEITNQIVSQLRDTARKFREELNDFSNRVVGLINDDVRRYYDALHPGDAVRPYLAASIIGNQRTVTLKSDFPGAPGRDAVSLLSESHRNSLGLSILLAFMKYKRRSGNPVEFLVLDDVTQSFDVGHRLSLIKFLEDPTFPEISQGQILFLTHDRTLADLIKRAGDQDRQDWIRYDIRSWQFNAMLVEPHNLNLSERAKELLLQGDELAAAIYGRHALEEVCRKIVQTAGVRMQFYSYPWRVSVEKFQEAILSEVRVYWVTPVQKGSISLPFGMINPTAVNLDELDRALRVLHYTVHDSAFLENPPALLEVQSALDAVLQLRDLFTCPNCRSQTPPKYQYFHQLTRDKQGNPFKCKGCGQQLPCHTP